MYACTPVRISQHKRIVALDVGSMAPFPPSQEQADNILRRLVG